MYTLTLLVHVNPIFTTTAEADEYRKAVIYTMPTVAAGDGHILKIDFVLADAQAGAKCLRWQEDSECSGCALSEVIKRRSADTKRLKNENAELKRQVEALEEQVRSSPVS